MTIELILFLPLALTAIAAALGMLFSKNAIYSALYLVLNFVTVAVIYLLLDAPFIAMAQVTVYAGAIMVLFLFVIMIMGTEALRKSHTLAWQQPLAIALSLVLLIEAGYIIIAGPGIGGGQPSQLTAGFGSPTSIGDMLFNQYLLPFEVTSVLLLVAMIGAIVLTKRQKKA